MNELAERVYNILLENDEVEEFLTSRARAKNVEPDSLEWWDAKTQAMQELLVSMTVINGGTPRGNDKYFFHTLDVGQAVLVNMQPQSVSPYAAKLTKLHAPKHFKAKYIEGKPFIQRDR